MKYNKSYYGKDFQKYQEYLSSVKPKLSKNIFDFFSDPGRHDFSNRSLHDSVLKKEECVRSLDSDTLAVSLILVNANFDREFLLHLQDVSQYKITQEASDMSSDLITHEVGIEQDAYENEKIVFRAMFSGEDTMVEIYFAKMCIEEKMLE